MTQKIQLAYVPAGLIVGLPVMVADVSTAALKIFKISVQLVKMVMIDSTLVIHTVAHIKIVVNVIVQSAGVYGFDAAIDLIQNICTVSVSVGKSKETVIFFQVIIVF